MNRILRQITVIFAALLLLFNSSALCQNSPSSEADLKKEAAKYFDDDDFANAYPLYSQLLSLYQQDPDYNYRFGACMLFFKADKAKPIDYLEFAVKKPGIENLAYYYLGRAYHLNYRFDDAIKAYQHFQQIASSSELKKHPVDHLIQMCGDGKTLLKDVHDLDVLVKKELSTADYFHAYDLSVNGGTMLIEPDDFKTKLDKKKGLNSVIYLSPDRSEVFFASYGDNDQNGKDIYKVKRLPTGGFSKPENLGTIINSPYDEDFPFYDAPTHTLYFSSKGHNSMGGYDIFKSVYNPSFGTWSTPVNMDFPINTPDDDILFIADTVGQTAYFASSRESPGGTIDIFKIKLQQKAPENVLLKGIAYSDNGKLPVASTITVKNYRNGNVVGVFNSSHDDGSYFMTLPNDAQLVYSVETPGHASQSVPVLIPKEEDLVTLKQEIGYDTVTDKLIVTNHFESEHANQDYLLALDYIRRKARMDVNIDTTIPIASTNNNNAVDLSTQTNTANNTSTNNNNTVAANNSSQSNNNSANNSSSSNPNNSTSTNNNTVAANDNNQSNNNTTNNSTSANNNTVAANNSTSNNLNNSTSTNNNTVAANNNTQSNNNSGNNNSSSNPDNNASTNNNLVTANNNTQPNNNSGNNSSGNSSNDQLVKVAENDAQQDVQAAQTAKDEANKATEYASDKLQEAQSLNNQAKEITDNANTINDPAKKNDSLAKANSLKQQANDLTKKAIEAFQVAAQEQADAKAKQQQADRAKQYSSSLDSAVKVKDNNQAIANLVAQQQNLKQQQQSIPVTNNNVSAGDLIRQQAQNTQQDSAQISKHNEALRQEINGLQQQSEDYVAKAQKTDNSQEKVAYLQQAKDLAESKKNKQNEIETNNKAEQQLHQQFIAESSEAKTADSLSKSNPEETSQQVSATDAANIKQEIASYNPPTNPVVASSIAKANAANNTSSNSINSGNNNNSSQVAANNNSSSQLANNTSSSNPVNSNNPDNTQNTQQGNNNTTNSSQVAANNQNSSSNNQTGNNQQTAVNNTQTSNTQNTTQNNSTNTTNTNTSSSTDNSASANSQFNTTGNVVTPQGLVKFSDSKANQANQVAQSYTNAADTLSVASNNIRAQISRTSDEDQARALSKKADSLDNLSQQKKLQGTVAFNAASSNQFIANKHQVVAWQDALHNNGYSSNSDATTTANLLLKDANFYYNKSFVEKQKADSTNKPYLKQSYLDNASNYLATALVKQQSAEKIFLDMNPKLASVPPSKSLVSEEDKENQQFNIIQTDNTTSSNNTSNPLNSNTNTTQANVTQAANNNNNTGNSQNNSTNQVTQNNTTNLTDNSTNLTNLGSNTTAQSNQNSTTNPANNSTTLTANNTSANNSQSAQNNNTNPVDGSQNNTVTNTTNNSGTNQNNNQITQNNTGNNSNSAINNAATNPSNSNSIATQNSVTNATNNSTTLTSGNNASTNTNNNASNQSNGSQVTQNNVTNNANNTALNTNSTNNLQNNSNTNSSNNNASRIDSTLSGNNVTASSTTTNPQNNSANTSTQSNNTATTQTDPTNNQNNTVNSSQTNNTANNANNTSLVTNSSANNSNSTQNNNSTSTTNNTTQNTASIQNANKIDSILSGNNTSINNNTVTNNTNTANTSNAANTNNSSANSNTSTGNNSLVNNSNTTNTNNSSNANSNPTNSNTSVGNNTVANNTNSTNTNNSTNAAQNNNVTTDNTTSSVTNNTTSENSANSSASLTTAITTDVFTESRTSPYSTKKPIPINPPLPEGLVFKVQIGAFRNSIPQNLFKGIQPVTGETTATGLTRYTAGFFKELNKAQDAQGVIRGLGFRDAFVVAFYNGKRISIAQASSILNGGAPNLTATQNNVNQNNATNTTANTTQPTTTGTPVAATAIGNVKGLFYTIQVGAYLHPISTATLYNLSPIFSFNAPNGYIRYNCGIFSNLSIAGIAKHEITTKTPIQDAFIVAYMNGDRLTIVKAGQLLGTGEATVAKDPNLDVMPGGASNSSTNVQPPALTPTPFTTTTNITPAPVDTAKAVTPNTNTNPTNNTAPVNTNTLPATSNADNNQVVSRTFSSVNILPAGDATVSVTIRRGTISGFVKLEENVPSGFVASEGDGKGATFKFENGILGYVWPILPSDSLFTVTYKITALSTATGLQTFTGKLLYTVNSEKQEIAIAPAIININGGSTTPPTDTSHHIPTTPAATTNDTSKVSFCVQVGTFSGPIPIDMANKLLQISNQGIKAHKEDNGSTAYTIGDYPNYTSADLLKQELVKDGYTSSFIVAYYQGKKISLQQAQLLMNK